MPESNDDRPVGLVPSPGAGVDVSPRGAGNDVLPNAGLGNPAYNVGAASGDLATAKPPDPPPRRLRRLHRVWPDRDGNVSYLLTLCVEGRARVLDNDATFTRFTAFLLDSPPRYGWYPRRFVVMPDHIHLIARQGNGAVRLGQWIKALKAVVGGLERQTDTERAAGEPVLAEHNVVGPVPSPGAGGDVPPNAGLETAGLETAGLETAGLGNPAYNTTRDPVGRVPSPGASVEPPPGGDALQPGTGKHTFTRIKRSWRWQEGFHDYKFRTPESEQRKWEYVCLNPVRYGLVARPEDWPFGGEVFYDVTVAAQLVRGTPALLETGLLMVEKPKARCTR